MSRRWWLLFRSLAVPTVLFLAPALTLQELRPLSYLVSIRGALAELALQISVVLLIEILCAALLSLVLCAGRALRLWNDRADTNCAGFLTLVGTTLWVLSLLFPLEVFFDPVVGTGAQAALVLAAIVALTLFGWQRAFVLLNRLDRSAQTVLAICPFLLIPVLAGGFGWRGFDAMPQARPSVQDVLTKPNVVLISFDALTAQDMSLYSYRLPTTPQFERLARRSYNFVNFVSTSDFTSPAAASLLTGQYPLTIACSSSMATFRIVCAKTTPPGCCAGMDIPLRQSLPIQRRIPSPCGSRVHFPACHARQSRRGFFLEPHCCSFGIACCSMPPTGLQLKRSSGISAGSLADSTTRAGLSLGRSSPRRRSSSAVRTSFFSVGSSVPAPCPLPHRSAFPGPVSAGL